MISIMRAPAGRRSGTAALASHRRESGHSRCDFKERAFPMAEERWSVAHGQENYIPNRPVLDKN